MRFGNLFHRKNHQRSVDELQLSLEAEARGRIEALRLKKKLEQDVLELEAALDNTNRARSEVEKNYKRYNQQMRELQVMVEEEQQAAQEARAEHSAADRRAGQLATELEDTRSQVELMEKEIKTVQNELHEAVEKVAELSTANAALAAAKRKVEADVQALNVSEFSD